MHVRIPTHGSAAIIQRTDRQQLGVGYVADILLLCKYTYQMRVYARIWIMCCMPGCQPAVCVRPFHCPYVRALYLLQVTARQFFFACIHTHTHKKSTCVNLYTYDVHIFYMHIVVLMFLCMLACFFPINFHSFHRFCPKLWLNLKDLLSVLPFCEVFVRPEQTASVLKRT